jgi:hypothetical protein
VEQPQEKKGTRIMPKHPVTGEDVSNPVYEAVVAEMKRAKEVEAVRIQEAEERLVADLEREGLARTLPESRWDEQSSEPRQVVASGGSFMPFAMLLMFICMMFMGGYLIYQNTRTPAAPAVPVDVVPVGDLTALVAPIKAKLEYDPIKAEAVRDAYAGFGEAVAGASGKRVTDSRVLESVQSAFLTDIAAKGGVSVGMEIDKAIAGHLGISWGSDGPGEESGYEFKVFGEAEQVKLAEILNAISKAAGESL